ncbi:MAG: hypothetical protein U9Q81_11850 [Pseudomonadota bacterium]|nr:hypothetical protein [Pseudomonadota bacterium]
MVKATIAAAAITMIALSNVSSARETRTGTAGAMGFEVEGLATGYTAQAGELVEFQAFGEDPSTVSYCGIVDFWGGNPTAFIWMGFSWELPYGTPVVTIPYKSLWSMACVYAGGNPDPYYVLAAVTHGVSTQAASTSTGVAAFVNETVIADEDVDDEEFELRQRLRTAIEDRQRALQY